MLQLLLVESCQDDYTTSIIRAKQWQAAVDLLGKVPHQWEHVESKHNKMHFGGALLDTNGDITCRYLTNPSELQ